MIRLSVAILLALLCLVVVSRTGAQADTALISSGGAVHQLEGNTNVSMESEVVRMSVHKHVIKTDCSFVFFNDGPECTARTGFPDETSFPLHNTKKRLSGSFLTYTCFIDGQKVKSELVEGDHRESVWHASFITFRANARQTVHVKYTVTPAAVGVTEKMLMKAANYDLHTAASWRGSIGTADFYIEFNTREVKDPIKAIPQDDIPNDEGKQLKWFAELTPDSVICAKSPEIEGRTLHFRFQNLRPTEKDDLLIMYAPKAGAKALGYAIYALGRNAFHQNLAPGSRRIKE